MTKLSAPHSRVYLPAGHNHTNAKFKRRMTDKARDADPWHKPEKKRGGWRYLAALALLGMAAMLALIGCAPSDSIQSHPISDAKRAAAGAWACPGMHASWISETEVMCLKQKP